MLKNIRRVVLHAMALDPSFPIPEEVIESVHARLSRRFQLSVEVSENLSLPQRAYSSERDQYRAIVILNQMKKELQTETTLHLAITDVDLFAPGMNFLFGEALPDESVAVISLARIDPRFYGEAGDLEKVKERAAKEAVHEVGHLFGLGHCEDPMCVMWFSDDLIETDSKTDDFCPVHLSQLKKQSLAA